MAAVDIDRLNVEIVGRRCPGPDPGFERMCETWLRGTVHPRREQGPAVPIVAENLPRVVCLSGFGRHCPLLLRSSSWLAESMQNPSFSLFFLHLSHLSLNFFQVLRVAVPD